MSILVTGGLGYIGSHTVVELLETNNEVIIIDNLINSDIKTLDRIKEITNKDVTFYNFDVRDEIKLDTIFNNHKIDSVIHFASLKAVGESVEKPLDYYDNNLISAINLIKIMQKHNVNNFVFSSSATVYGVPSEFPITEDFPLSAINPYGRTKLIIEDILRDICYSNKNFNVAILRYFNPVGAHQSGKLGESPNGIPNNLMPYILKVANKKIDKLSIFGNDYDTPDGTGIRDYIHVVDLSIGHLKALDKLKENPGLVTYNLGTGKGYSVLELVNTFSSINNIDVPYIITERRPGDVPTYYACAKKAKKELNWVAKFDINEMCKDAWRWEQNNI